MNSPKITIGIPTYNGEKHIEKRIKSLLSQTFTDFELIISDDGSTDSTPEICRELEKKDKRIKFYHHEKNMGLTQNFDFLLKKATGKYFMWAAQDDMVDNTFLQKTYSKLEKDNSLIGCSSRVESIEVNKDEIEEIDLKFRKIIKWLSKSIKKLDTFSLYGPYEKKVREYLKGSTCQIMYGLFKKEVLRKSFVTERFMGNDWPVMINALKYGNFKVIDETLMHRYGTLSESGMINISKTMNKNMLGVIFPFYPLIWWCAKNMTFQLFMKNLDFFIQLIIEGEVQLIFDLFRIIIKKITPNK